MCGSMEEETETIGRRYNVRNSIPCTIMSNRLSLPTDGACLFISSLAGENHGIHYPTISGRPLQWRRRTVLQHTASVMFGTLELQVSIIIPPSRSMGDTQFAACLFFVCLYGYGFLSGGKKIAAWSSACVFSYYRGMSCPILVNFGWRGVTAAALLPGCTARRTGAKARLPARHGGQSELGAAASRKAVWWDLRLASLLTHLFCS